MKPFLPYSLIPLLLYVSSVFGQTESQQNGLSYQLYRMMNLTTGFSSIGKAYEDPSTWKYLSISPFARDLIVDGNIGIGIDEPSSRLNIGTGSDVNLTGGNGYLMLGNQKGFNIAMDENEIMARENGSVAILNLQIEGGATHFGGPIDLNRRSTGIAMRVDEKEALWFDGSVFSWGFGGSSNFFSDEVGIGIFNPTEKLEVSGNAVVNGDIRSNEYKFVGTNGAGLRGFGGSIEATGNFIPIDNPQVIGAPTLPWNGIFLSFPPTIVDNSSLKTNQKALQYGLKEVLRLNPISFDNSKSLARKKHLGLRAAEVKKIIPDIVHEYDDISNGNSEENAEVEPRNLSLNYTELIPVLIKAIQEQQSYISNQENEIEILKSELAQTRLMNKQLESKILQIESHLGINKK